MRTILLLLILAVPIAAQQVDAVLVDQFESVPCEDAVGRLDSFLVDLQNSSGWKGVVIGYEGRYLDYRMDKYVLPVLGQINSRVELIRNHIEFRRFDPSRIVFISGGFRENHQFELYKVPPGGKFPVAKPTLDSMKYRRGKPSPIP